MEQKFTVSKETAQLIAVVAQLKQAKEAFYSALCDQYGEDRAQEIYTAEGETFDAAAARVMYWLGEGISEKLEIKDNTEI